MQLAQRTGNSEADSIVFTAGPEQSLMQSATLAITVAGGAKVMPVRIRTARIIDPATPVVAVPDALRTQAGA